MALIHVCPIDGAIPSEIGAWLAPEDWPGGGTVPVLYLSFGADTIRVWPADPERLVELADKLRKIAGELDAAATAKRATPK